MNTIYTKEQILTHQIRIGGSFGMSLEGDCRELEVIQNLELLVTFGMSLKKVCKELFTINSCLIRRELFVTTNSSKKVPSKSDARMH